MNLTFTNQVAVITGGSSGIGAAVVRMLTRAGAHCVIADLNVPLGQTVAASLQDAGPAVDVVACNVTDRTSIGAVIDHAAAKQGRIDVLVNCAGWPGPSKNAEEVDPDIWRRVLDINLQGTVDFITAAIPGMKAQRKGKIVNIASIAGLTGSRGQVPYSGAKAAVIGVTFAFAKELMQFGINVNAIAPGFIDTPMTQEMTAQTRTAWRVDRLTVGGRMGVPDDIAATAVFLASSAADYITGAVIPVDGGFTLGYP